MASVASAGASPLSGYEFAQAGSTGDPDENPWTLINQVTGSSASSTTGLSFSQVSGSLSSWAMVNAHGRQVQPSPPAMLSSLNLDFDQSSFPASTYGDTTRPAFSVTSAPADAQFLSNTASHHHGQHFLPDELLFHDQAFSSNLDISEDISSFLNTFSPLETMEQPVASPDLQIPPPLQSGPNVPPWNPTNLKSPAGPAGDSPIFVMEDPGFVSPSPPQYQSPSVSPPASGSPRSPIQIKLETGLGDGTKKKATAASVPITIRRVRGAARVEKKKASTFESPTNISRGGSGSSSSSTSQFLIVTPDSVNAHAGKPNPFECFEAARPSQKGRKGPLANDTKENALQVRRVGACFCCHARKVRCDKERPCRNCTKLMMQVPQVICWQFQDFLPVLFPPFIRGHFKKEEMAKFISDNIDGFTVDGVEKPCVVELFSGANFTTTFQIKAKFFTAKTPDVLQHWHMQVGRNCVDLLSRGAAPIGLDMDGNSPRDELRKKAREYIQAIVQEPAYAEQVTDALRHTDLPRRILRIVQKYSQRCEHPIVKKALSIYAMHYVMTRHLCLTRQSIINLQSTKLVPQNVPWVTPRVLNRQIKSVIDEMLMREMQVLFESFSKSLKPKSRKEWAPCLASFLVLCLFMESVEMAADNFVVSQNEINLRDRNPPQYKRSFALDINKEVENLPFKQFAYQFHQIYQTHSKDAAAKSFNPLVDESSMELAELDGAAAEMIWQLRQFVLDRSHWQELDFLCADPILPNEENHPYPRDISFNYNGRLIAKFLLSFTDEKYIFGPC